MKQLSPRQREALEAIAEGRFLPCLVKEDDGWHARWRAVGADNPWLDGFVRDFVVTPLSADAEDQRHDTLHDAWMLALRSRTGLVRWDDSECAAFAADLDEWSGGVDDDGAVRSAIRFSLESDADGFRIVCPVPQGRAALKALGQATFVFGALRAMKPVARDGGEVLCVVLSVAEAEFFVKSAAKALADAGYAVEGCDIAGEVAAEADVEDAAPGKADAAGDAPSATLRLRVRVAGEVVDAEEIRFLLDQKSSIVFFRDRWIEVDRGILKEALRALERQDGGKLTVNEAVAFASGIGFAGSIAVAPADSGKSLRALVNELNATRRGAGAGGVLDAGRPIPGLAGELRPYQRRGVAWIRFLTDNGFGALLADDMGLGKTIQTIAWILGNGEWGMGNGERGPVLIVAPLTLVANWRREFAKFAPSLSVYVHQGAARQMEYGFKREAAKSDVVLTSISLLVRDYHILRRVGWSAVVVDEAQAIKNPDSHVARALCALGAPRRLALTGTPVENSVADLWSLEHFLNPGLLGDRHSFDVRFARPAAADPGCAAARRLAHAVEPFILRRLKTDPEISGELGPKREVREYCALSARQRTQYEDALAEYRAGEHRQGDVFALLTRLKLICDGDGKLDRLSDLLEAIFAAGESALVFTQYAKVGRQIKAFLKDRFGRDFPFLHGALSAAEREREVERFTKCEGPSAFLLSLRAGGFGLNLVKATHVIHFDRWWNPAVESQATDRAHRIGQRGTVLVHAFITEGTLEERVDDILRRKSLLAGSLVTNGESFLREMSPEEFEEVVGIS